MAITFDHGLNGSGKTYHAIKDMLIPALKAGRNVITNVDGLQTDYMQIVFDIPFEHMSRLRIISPPDNDLKNVGSEADKMYQCWQYAQNQTNTLILWDELDLYFPAREKRQKLLGPLLVFLKQHRKGGNDVHFMGVDFQSIDPILIRQMEFNTHFKKMRVFGRPKSYTGNTRYGSGITSQPIKTVFGNYEALYYNAYKSFRADAEGETKYTKMRYLPKGLIFAGVFAIAAISYGVHGIFWGNKKDAKSHSVSAVSDTLRGASGRTNAPKYALVSDVRLGGYFQEEPRKFRLFGCDGETIGFTDKLPSDYGTIWKSCTETGNDKDSGSGEKKRGSL